MSAQPNPILYWCDFCEADHETLRCQHPRYESPGSREALESKVEELELRVDDLEAVEGDIEVLIDDIECWGLSDDKLIARLRNICMAF